MINHDVSANDLAPLYAAARPFPHIVIDNFLDPTIASRVADQLEVVDLSTWHQDEHRDQVNKWTMSDPGRLDAATASVLNFLNSENALSFFHRLTGIGPLHADSGFLGGGVHISGPGGRLGVHADFNIHPSLGLHRRLNALLFLNREWDPIWNGDLELYDETLTVPVVTVSPVFNRLAVFSVSDRAFHGVPKVIECPVDRRRISLALYYYSTDRPDEEKAAFHWAAWQQTSPS
jgi:hypothetical protein